MSGRRLDHQSERDVAGVGVAPPGPGLEHRLVRGSDGDQPARRPHLAAVVELGEEHLVLGVVVEAARVVQQLPDGDVAPVRDEPGQQALDGVVERELSLSDELEDDRRHEHLRLAADPEAVGWPHSRSRARGFRSRGVPNRVVAVADEHERAGHTGSDDRVERACELERCPTAPPVGRGGRAAAGEQEQR